MQRYLLDAYLFSHMDELERLGPLWPLRDAVLELHKEPEGKQFLDWLVDSEIDHFYSMEAVKICSANFPGAVEAYTFVVLNHEDDVFAARLAHNVLPTPWDIDLSRDDNAGKHTIFGARYWL